MRWCQGVPQARTPWRAPVAGASSSSWRRAVGHRTPEGRRSPSFLRPPLGCSRRAPVVAMRPLCLGGLAVVQPGLGTPWGTGPVGRMVGARVRDRCHRPSLAGGGGVGGAVPPVLAQALGQPRAPLAACLWGVVPPAAGQPPTMGGRRQMSWMLRLPPGGGPREALPVAHARLT